MNTWSVANATPAFKSVPLRAVKWFWAVARFSLLPILVLLEPVVACLCVLGIMLGVFTSIVFEVSAVGPNFPFAGMLALSFGFGAIVFLYYGLIALLSR